MSDQTPYTPSLNEARACWRENWYPRNNEAADASFDRLIAQVRAEAWEAAVRDVLERALSDRYDIERVHGLENPYRTAPTVSSKERPMTDREKLIEEAAKAIRGTHLSSAWDELRESDREYRREQARAALAVFEKAHTPTDDERAFAWAEYRKDYEPNPAHFDREAVAFRAGWDAATGFRRTEVPEPSADFGCPHEACEIDTAGNPTRCADCGDDLAAVPEPSAEIICTEPGHAHCDRQYTDAEPQGEPSDAMIDAALKAWGHYKWVGLPTSNQVAMRAALRAALRAAGEVQR